MILPVILDLRDLLPLKTEYGVMKTKIGIQDFGEDSIPFISVELYNSSNSFIASTTTDQNGIYTFTKLEQTTYRVRVKSTGADINAFGNCAQLTTPEERVSVHRFVFLFKSINNKKGNDDTHDSNGEPHIKSFRSTYCC